MASRTCLIVSVSWFLSLAGCTAARADAGDEVPAPAARADPWDELDADPPALVRAAPTRATLPADAGAFASAEIWPHPVDPPRSRIVAALGPGGLGVHDLDGAQVQRLVGPRLDDLDLRTRGDGGALVLGLDRRAGALAAYELDAAGRARALGPALALAEPGSAAGVCLHRAGDGTLYAFVTAGTAAQQWRLVGDAGALRAAPVRTLGLGAPTRGCAVDDALAVVYVAAGSGVWRFPAAPDVASAPAPVAVSAPEGPLLAEPHALAIVPGPGEAGHLLIGSSAAVQVFERGERNAYLGAFAVDGEPGAAPLHGGISVAATDLGPGFTRGLFLAQTEVAAQELGRVPWDAVAAALGLEPDEAEGPRPARP